MPDEIVKATHLVTDSTLITRLLRTVDKCLRATAMV